MNYFMLDTWLLSVGRSCAFRHLVGVRANLGGYGYDSKRQHPNRHNRRKGLTANVILLRIGKLVGGTNQFGRRD